MTAPRTATVVTHMRCNQNCRYCDRRSPVDDARFIRGEAVRARIDAALVAGAREIVLTGGEPGLRADLADLVAHAARAGAEAVGLETNATTIDAARAQALRQAGLGFARLNLAGVSPALDEVTRDPGGFSRTLAGAAALAAAGVRIDVLATLVRSTRASIPELPGFLAGRGWPVHAIEIVVPADGPAPEELLPFDEAAPVVAAVEAAARAVGIAVRMSPGDGIPPCLFPAAARLQHLYSFTPGRAHQAGHTQVDACRGCLVADRCSGLPDAVLARRAPPPMFPVREERARRRLAMVAPIPEQIAAELCATSIHADAEGRPALDEIIRINFRCNQACTFCFVSTHLPAAAGDVVAAKIREASARGSRVVISGGEPTLNARLPDYLRLARAGSAHPVVLQTNAVRLDDARLVATLVEAGLGEVFVSLHAATAEISDAITEAPGTFARTVAGIDNLHRAGVPTLINFVICEANRRQPADFVRFVAARWPGFEINVSFVAASTDVVPRERALIPRYSDVLPALGEAAAEAARLGVTLTGLESMCGLPLCLVPPALADLALTEIPAGFAGDEFIHVDACASCRHRKTCWGVRRGYAELYGTGELVTVPAAPEAGTGTISR
jgi:molybdenum cofactor biosynthesis enzyme MoaA